MASPAIPHDPSAAKHWIALLGSLVFVILPSLSCFNHPSAQQRYDQTYRLFLEGNLAQCRTDANAGYQTYRNGSAGFAAKFANLEAECLIWAGLYRDALSIYSNRKLPFDDTDSRIFALSLQASAQTHLRDSGLSGAQELLREASALCLGTTFASCANARIAMGMLSVEEGDLDQADQHLSEGLTLARGRGDRFAEATAQLDLGFVALRKRHFDESADRIAETFRLCDALGAREIAQNALGNQAWGYYRLGNFTGALELFREAERRAAALGDFADEASWLTGIGKVQFERSEFAAATEAFQRALTLEEEKVQSVEDIYSAEVPLAQLALQRGDLPEAEQHIQKALAIAHSGNSRVDELYPVLIQGQIEAHRGAITEAARKFTEVEQDEQSPVFVKWEAQRLLARLAEQQNDQVTAARKYRAALSTFENARSTVHQEALQISFLSNGSRIYADYVHFLMQHGRTNDALRWADFSRARTLSQGLGVLSKAGFAKPPQLAAQETAGRVQGTLLFYWLGETQSYLWAITSRKTARFTLPPAAEIEAAVQRYRQAIDSGPDVLDSAEENGRLLYQMLITPTQSLLGKDAKVFILPDGQLNNLNFETLLAPSPKLHYWIDDVTVANASSLRMLDAWSKLPVRGQGDRSLLLVGDPLPPEKYPTLPKARAQMDIVNAHFVGAERKILTGAEATTATYLEGHPENYSYIHFVTHGIASRLSPLDSAIVLSQSSAASDSFKLYARDIVQRPLRAELVTIAACYGAKGPSYSGEGLVGLSWAFLRAGAHNVVAALWEVTDAPTPQQMDEFYGRIERGESPMAALRMSKLALLHGDRYRNPHYWATFQFYVGAGLRAGAN